MKSKKQATASGVSIIEPGVLQTAALQVPFAPMWNSSPLLRVGPKEALGDIPVVGKLADTENAVHNKKHPVDSEHN